MADRERELVPRFNSEETEASTAVFLSVWNGWRAKSPIVCSGAKRARGDVDSEKFREIGRGSSRQNMKTDRRFCTECVVQWEANAVLEGGE